MGPHPSKVEYLDLAKSKVQDQDLAALKVLFDLRWLHLDDTQVTDAGLVHLKPLGQLWKLHLSDTKVAGAGLKHLRALRQLSELHLDDTQVSDAGLEHLKPLTQLQRLYLTGTKVTRPGVGGTSKAIAEVQDLRVALVSARWRRRSGGGAHGGAKRPAEPHGFAKHGRRLRRRLRPTSKPRGFVQLAASVWKRADFDGGG